MLISECSTLRMQAEGLEGLREKIKKEVEGMRKSYGV